ncbi:hypothetical protein F544_750 [Bibersteinia trehalosi USDA-ARS-USMARC-190]|uniref:Uncharacterized protein n=1 Tax=Bibersteinia trehalosi USDA-ARS-USMARC-190 TaxID=1263832 RepID=W0R4V5_BIBTR|nr:hypothetical protein F544_750 [Bibersteinia trehalosi USDA-ARS-USMARC-190]
MEMTLKNVVIICRFLAKIHRLSKLIDFKSYPIAKTKEQAVIFI